MIEYYQEMCGWNSKSLNTKNYVTNNARHTMLKKSFLMVYVKHWHILKKTTEPAGPFGTMPQEPWHPGKDAKPDCVIQLSCREVRTHASYKTTRAWENFNNQGTKLILLSDELWLTLKRLGGGGSNWLPSVVFQKLYLLNRGWNPGFLWILELS